VAQRVVRMPMTKARINLGSVVRGVHVDGDVVVLEKDGIPVAGLVDIDALEDYLETRDPALRRRMRESMKAHRSGRTRPVRELLEELKPKGRK
jgi:antitoxin (DNA-binding transcriptional repressor) of toxin-antitoxin stability system